MMMCYNVSACACGVARAYRNEFSTYAMYSCWREPLETLLPMLSRMCACLQSAFSNRHTHTHKHRLQLCPLAGWIVHADLARFCRSINFQRLETWGSLVQIVVVVFALFSNYHFHEPKLMYVQHSFVCVNAFSPFGRGAQHKKELKISPGPKEIQTI